MNRKGFMMAELVVVSSVIIITLVGLYSSYNKIYSMYNTRMNYYDVVTLYRLGYYRDILEENNVLDAAINQSKTGVLNIYESIGPSGIFSLPENERVQNGDVDKVYLINNRGYSINKTQFQVLGVKPTFLDYIDYFNNSIDYGKFNYVLLMESCASSSTNESDCKYAYLEVYEDIDEYDYFN